MSEEAEREVPDGAAVFPEIPEELGIDPLFLGVLHALVFLAGSTSKIVQDDAADEAVEQIAAYLQRLQGAKLDKILEDMESLVAYSRQQKWPKQLILALKSLLEDIGIGRDAGE